MDILERLKSATAASRELDAEIAKAIGYQNVGHHDVGSPHLWGWYGLSPDGDKVQIPPFTASIDAALALVERMLPGWKYEIRPRFAKLLNPHKPRSDASGMGDTPALAILIALFTALKERPP